MRSLACVLLLLAAFAFPERLEAQQRTVPYWASTRVNEVNMRVGPSPEFRIAWIYKRVGVPLRVVRVREGWRLVEDKDGARGWVAARLLTEERTVMVVQPGLTPMREEPDAGARLLWRLERDVIARLETCAEGWCRIAIGKRRGWAPANHLWGI
ncbi:hypothetical protein EYB45_07450 [Erythrobacteraceae bacterium CFH 75059]|uniref:SH3 domain-containing protein n=1 Tax=Qipengyuania thermophila TaxID=2509361 RepID=UPI00101EB9EC|nr:SH3 domain-containing protein [Qipengyuania thermophila]TCD05307.1 hypothetical protein EYB45_07450 [Erythrobacteraceae bacterium CFH 75059]